VSVHVHERERALFAGIRGTVKTAHASPEPTFSDARSNLSIRHHQRSHCIGRGDKSGISQVALRLAGHPLRMAFGTGKVCRGDRSTPSRDALATSLDARHFSLRASTSMASRVCLTNQFPPSSTSFDCERSMDSPTGHPRAGNHPSGCLSIPNTTTGSGMSERQLSPVLAPSGSIFTAENRPVARPRRWETNPSKKPKLPVDHFVAAIT
jgi:hypothetical protein